MGKIKISGPKSLEFLQQMTTNDLSKLTQSKAQYTVMCYENGGTVDDLIIYMVADFEYVLVVNAANTIKDYKWLNQNNKYDFQQVQIEIVTHHYVQLALQGPNAERILQKLTKTNLQELRFFECKHGIDFLGMGTPAMISRTGYTGEDGFEIYIHPQEGRNLWKKLLQLGMEEGIQPIGLGARDTLRLEAGLPLYGQELSKEITPMEANLNFVVKLDKGVDFIGRKTLTEQKMQGPQRKIVGIEMIEKGIPRHGCNVLIDNSIIGYVTSGTHSPTLKKSIGMALLDSQYSSTGMEVKVQIRNRVCNAIVVPLPFYPI